jgi:hypothetical protein
MLLKRSEEAKKQPEKVGVVDVHFGDFYFSIHETFV